MHLRSLFWLMIVALLAGGVVRAQAPAAGVATPSAATPMPPGLVLVARVSGTVTLTEGDQVTKAQLKQDDQIPQKAKVNTMKGASIVLVFSNGASVQVAEDSELVLDEFLQDPFAATLKVAELEEEPTPSKTTLTLNRGELVGSVKKLKKELSFTVNTPVGAAGIRGTTFRIVFRPAANGQAFFTLTTATGVVAFTSNSGNTTTTQPGPTVTATGTANGVPVSQGQEIVFNVTVATDAAGKMTVVAQPVTPPSATPAQVANMQSATAVAVEIAVAVQNAVFTPPPPPPPNNTTGGGTTPTGTGDPSTPGSGTTTGTTTGSTTGTTTGTTSGTNTGTTTPPTNSTPTTTTVTTPNTTTIITVTPPPAPPPRIVTGPQ